MNDLTTQSKAFDFNSAFDEFLKIDNFFDDVLELVLKKTKSQNEEQENGSRYRQNQGA